MKVLRQFAMILTMVLPLIAPAMACALPGARMTQAEMACCKQMTTQCGSANMPASHGCCHKDLPTFGYLTAVPPNLTLPTMVSTMVLGALPIANLPHVPADHSSLPRIEDTSPQSPPAAIFILRI